MAARSELQHRTDSDVSSESGCSPGVAVYTSLYGGWLAGICGTSVVSPFMAGIIAIAGNSASKFGVNGGKHFWTLKKKKLKKGLHRRWATTAAAGKLHLHRRTNQFGQYSGPGGWGTPNGTKDF